MSATGEKLRAAIKHFGGHYGHTVHGICVGVSQEPCFVRPALTPPAVPACITQQLV